MTTQTALVESLDTTSAPTPYDSPQAWDTLVIAGQTCPADMVFIEGWSRSYTWQDADGRGVDGATTRFSSGPLAKGSIRIVVAGIEPSIAAKAAQYRATQAFVDALKYQPGKVGPLPVTVASQRINVNNINAIVIDDISGPTSEPGSFWFEWTIAAHEYRQPTKRDVTSTPDATKGGASNSSNGQGGTTKADAALDAELDAARKAAEGATKAWESG